MAKKKKKLSKLNSAIRHIFDGVGFDDGIDLVERDTLMELTHVLGIIPDDYDKTSLVRTLRRTWSDADPQMRADIVDFLKAQNRVYKSSHPIDKAIEKNDKIDALIAEMHEVTAEEVKALHQAMMDVRTKKINRGKLEQKLAHLRFADKRTQVEKALEGQFDYDDSFVFHHAFAYSIFGESFKKIQPVRSAVFSYTYLTEQSADELIGEIGALKQGLIDEKQAQINAFLKQLSQGHPYLDETVIITALKSSPPSENVTTPPLSDSTLKAVIGKQLPGADAYQSDYEVIIDSPDTFDLPYSDQRVTYPVHIAIEKQALFDDLWQGRPIDLQQSLERSREESRNAFESELAYLVESCSEQARLLELDEATLHAKIYDQLLPQLNNSLHISSKVVRKVLFHFNQSIQQELFKKQRQALLARTIRDFKNLFPTARQMTRRLIFHTGPTNSGKTYEAMQHLKKADTGYYLAPLRLLALEGYEELKSSGIDVSLITGEEQLLDEEATHISSTIEMLNFDVDVDVCVIDEVQMLGDRDRGWAWANAIIGAPASTIVMTGSENAIAAVTALADYLGEPLEVIRFERKNRLELMRQATPISAITPGTAVVAFSRKEVLRLKQQLVRTHRVSVVYGNLSPEVRREEARRFREGETDVMVATDAIAMGLNLPIQTILFARGDKFDGESQRDLTPSEVHQIAGRAGRFGLKEVGYVGAIKPDILQVIHKQFPKAAKPISIPFNVSANLEHIKLVGTILEEESLTEILRFFVKNMQFEGPFRAINLEGMAEASEVVDRHNLDLTTKYHLACAPVTTSSPYIMESFERYIRALEQHKPVTYIPPSNLGDYATTMEQLLQAEDRVKEISLYLWLSYRFSDYFIDDEKAREYRGILNRYIESSLKQSEFVPRCRQCTKPLPLNSEYAICQSCFRKLNMQKRKADRSGNERKKQRR
jgi:ATP-dependent RNA helicase SUPV3L1/SUV3